MTPIPIKDPNAPPDPNELRDIPDAQHPAGSDVNRHNPVTPGVPPSPDEPTGTPPDEIKPPTEPPVELPPPEVELPPPAKAAKEEPEHTKKKK
jgi:hypothetical protein